MLNMFRLYSINILGNYNTILSKAETFLFKSKYIKNKAQLDQSKKIFEQV